MPVVGQSAEVVQRVTCIFVVECEHSIRRGSHNIVT